MSGPFIVIRPAGGLTINGYECLMNDEWSDYRKYDTEEQARDYLRSKGVPKPEAEGIEIVPLSEIDLDAEGAEPGNGKPIFKKSAEVAW